MKDDFDIIWEAFKQGDINKLEEYKEIIDDFPNGRDNLVNRYWITNAIHSENLESIHWVIGNNVNLNFIDVILQYFNITQIDVLTQQFSTSSI